LPAFLGTPASMVQTPSDWSGSTAPRVRLAAIQVHGRTSAGPPASPGVTVFWLGVTLHGLGVTLLRLP
jgi:hypothetical protein